MLLNISKKQNELIGKIGLTMVLLWPIFFVTRGIDVSDTSYYLANYKYYLTGQLSPNISMALSNIVSALLYNILPSAKLLSYRVLDWIMHSVAWVAVYNMFKKHLPSLWLIPALFIGSAMLRRTTMTLNYNTYSYTFLIIGLCLILKGIIENKYKHIALSGLLIGFNVFFRVPNGLQAIVVFLPIVYASLKQNTYKNAFKQSLIFTACGFIGLFTGLFFVLFVFNTSNVIAGLNMFIDLLNGSGSYGIHNIFAQIQRQINMVFVFIKNKGMEVLGIVLISTINSFFFAKSKNKPLNYAVGIASAILFLYLSIKTALAINLSTGIYMLAVLSFIFSLIGVFAFSKSNSKLALLCLANLVVLITVPLGTDTGLLLFIAVMPIVVCTIALVLYNIQFAWKFKSTSINKLLRNISLAVLGLVLIVGLKVATYDCLYLYAFRDAKYIELNTYTKVPLLYGMQTSKDRANAHNLCYEALNSKELQNYDLVSLGHPIAYVFGNQKPIMGEVWPDIIAVKDDYYKQVLDTCKAKNNLPLIIVGSYHSKDKLKQVYTTEFIVNNNYEMLVDTELFKLYKPPVLN